MTRPHSATAPLLALLLLAGSAAAGWTQYSGDAARTGAIDAGPVWGDVAFQVKLPGVPSSAHPVVDGQVYILTDDSTAYDPSLSEVALWRIDLGTAEVVRVASFPEFGTLDIAYPYVLRRSPPRGLEAYDAVSGDRLWAIPGPPSVANVPEVDVHYERPALAGETLYLPYIVGERVAGNPAGLVDFGLTTERGGLLALNARTGEVLWELDDAATLANLTGRSVAGNIAVGPTVLGYFSVDTTSGNPTRAGRVAYYALGIDLATGDVRWTQADILPAGTAFTGPAGLGTTPRFTGGVPLVTPTFAFLRTDRFLAVNPMTGTQLWSSEAGLADPQPIRGMLGAGWNEDVLVGVTAATAYRLDASTGAIRWQQTVTEPGRFYSIVHPAISGSTVYLPYFRLGEGPLTLGVEARDVASGEAKWAWERQSDVGPSNTLLGFGGFGDGVAVFATYDGVVTVLGRTAASLAPPALEATQYPAVGKEVRVDLSTTQAGAFGPATRYRADWGDGNATDWQDSPVFAHAYTTQAPVVARFTVANDANQTATAAVEYRVGQQAPNLISEAFSPERQELTFFLIGLVVTGGAGLWGFARVRRRGRILQRELADVEDTYASLRARPAECERALAQHRARGHALLRAHKLDDAKLHILDRRIDELQRKVRTSMVDERFDYLPRGLARRLEELLADGRVSAWEREAFDVLLERETILTPQQKEQVRALVAEWAREDAASS